MKVVVRSSSLLFVVVNLMLGVPITRRRVKFWPRVPAASAIAPSESAVMKVPGSDLNPEASRATPATDTSPARRPVQSSQRWRSAAQGRPSVA
jgi:hypothetical protein